MLTLMCYNSDYLLVAWIRTKMIEECFSFYFTLKAFRFCICWLLWYLPNSLFLRFLHVSVQVILFWRKESYQYLISFFPLKSVFFLFHTYSLDLKESILQVKQFNIDCFFILSLYLSRQYRRKASYKNLSKQKNKD